MPNSMSNESVVRPVGWLLSEPLSDSVDGDQQPWSWTPQGIDPAVFMQDAARKKTTITGLPPYNDDSD